MIIINVRFTVRPEFADQWLEITRELTEGSRAEDGCLWYDWARSVDEPDEFHLQEGWRDRAALDAHDVAPHHTASRPAMREALAATPRLIVVDGDTPGWQEIQNLAV